MTSSFDKIQDIQFTKALGDRYLSYALSTIVARSLPDVRDGLKPVVRRLLFAMRQLKLFQAESHKKSSRIVGDVIGKFHPHGETAIYDALVRLAQDFTLRYPLIDGQGNFGNVDGDNAAAMRYTEARLTEVAEALLEGIDQNAVDFKSTYDGETLEPIVMPAAFPNLLANGAIGIAVGMATSIPPHNVEELCLAMEHLIESPEASVKDLLLYVEGPDFPTGGAIIEEKASLEEAYETGRGSFRVRARYHVEDLKNGLYQIVVTEIPYQVQKGKLVEKIAELLLAKKLPLLGDVIDESTEDVRLVLIPKSRNVTPEHLMTSLFKKTELEARVSLNLNVLDKNNVPRVMNLKEALCAFLDHRLEVLERGVRFRMESIEGRLHTLDGFLLIYLNLDEVIRIIRYEDNPKQLIMDRWGLTEIQVEAILNMRLRSLQKLEELAIKKEHDALKKEYEALEALIHSDAKKWQVVKSQVQTMRKKFGKETALGARRTFFEEGAITEELPEETFIEREPVTVICSERGWVRSLKGHIKDREEVKYKEGDGEAFVLQGETIDKLLIFTSFGKFYTVGVDTLPGGRSFGEPMRLFVDLAKEEEILSLHLYKRGEEGSFLVVGRDGRGFVVPASHVVAQTKNGKQILNVKDNDAFGAIKVEGDTLALVGENRRMLLMPVNEVPQMNRGRGVMLQKYRGGGLSDLKFFERSQGFSWENGGRIYKLSEWESWLGKRGAAGRFVPPGFPRSNTFS